MSDPSLQSASGREEQDNLLSSRSRLNTLQILTATVGALVLLGGGFLLFVVLFNFVLGYGPGGTWVPVPSAIESMNVVLITVFLILLCGTITASLSLVVVRRRSSVAVGGVPRESAAGRMKQSGRTSLQRRLMVSHLATVTASTFIYASGGFVLLIGILVYGYNLQLADIPPLVPEFAGITIFVLVQIVLITFCGLIVATLASRRLSRRLIAQINELESATDAIAHGHLERRVHVLTEDELGRLARRFNLLAERLDSLDRERRAFVANVSHDLRTPITIIRGHLEAQQESDQSPPPDARTAFAAIEHETRTLTSLIDDLFTLSRLEEAALPMSHGVVELAPIATNAVDGIRPYALKTARVSVHAMVPAETPAVIGDSTRVVQIINNLLYNAIRHTPEGGVVMLTATAVEGGAWIEVEVRDTGVGIAAEELPRIFDRFYRGESTREGGTGLGLSIVKQLVEIQGGTVRAESTPGEGSAISFRLPTAIAKGSPH